MSTYLIDKIRYVMKSEHDHNIVEYWNYEPVNDYSVLEFMQFMDKVNKVAVSEQLQNDTNRLYYKALRNEVMTNKDMKLFKDISYTWYIYSNYTNYEVGKIDRIYEEVQNIK